MILAHPQLLWPLLPAFCLWAAAALALIVLDARGRVRSTPSLTFSAAHLLHDAPRSAAQRLRPWVQALRLVSVALLLFALLRPQTTRPGPKVWSRGVDIVLALDTSGSMQALDLDADRAIARRRTRLQVVKDVVQEFIRGRPNDQVGMVVFGSEAYTQCPLTLDHSIFASTLQRVAPGMAGDTTAIGSGLAAAINRLRRSAAKSRVIVLLTDGSNNAGALSPKRAAELAKTFAIKVYTIGAANRGPAPFLQDTLFGKQVQYAKVDLDEPTLRDIASTTGGAYFRAEDSRALAQIYAQIDRLEKSTMVQKARREVDEHFMPYVVLACVLLLVELVALHTRLRQLP